MSEFKFHAPENERQRAWIKTSADYEEMYQRSVDDPEGFWAEIAEEYFWYDKWKTVRSYNYDVRRGPVHIEWFAGGKTNITVNALDRHLEQRGDQVALIWEGNEPGEDRTFTYRQLYEEVNRFANVLRDHGVSKGDRVALYMPMVPELAIAMLAAARIGAVHSIVFSGFSAEALAGRIVDAKAKVLITTDGVYRGKKAIALKGNADQAMVTSLQKHGHRVEHCFVVRRTGQDVEMAEGRDWWWHEEMADISTWSEPEVMDAEDPLFILYTSGSTGKPKGVLHTVGGYMVYTGTTFKHVFDYHDGDVWWCTADIGWVTGHSYIVYGPLTQGATTVMFEGVPTYPDPGRFWDVVDKWKVTQFYTAPTAIRALMKEGASWVERHDLSSLRVLGSVGEPINPEAWYWYFKHVGKEHTPIVDTWWQTETGGILISALPYAIDQKPGSVTRPFFGVVPAVLDDEGYELHREAEGVLVLKEPWPGQMRTIYGDHQRFEETYFQMYPGYYFSGDGCRRDADGDYWITGRVDDVINVSGHRMGTAEVESALVAHKSVAEAAVVGFPHDIKGQGIYAYVTLLTGIEADDTLIKELVRHVRTEIGPIAAPDEIQFAPNLPKTRSGKIMRRILRKIAARDYDSLGDTSTLAEPAVVDGLIERRKAMSK